ncbi:MAG: BACON domain-containing protein [Akkermansia sp.]
MTFAETFAGGSGTKNDPYLIANAQQLSELTNYCGSQHQSTYFALVHDIDCSAITTWSPIGSYADNDFSHGFQGKLDGRGHSIQSLTLSTTTTNHVGMFACLMNAEIRDLHLTQISLSQQVVNISTAGILAAHVKDSQFYDCTTQGTILSFYQAGGFIGHDAGGSRFEYCQSNVSVSASFFAGGFTASAQAGSQYIHCQSGGQVQMTNESGVAFDTFFHGYAGGFIAYVTEAVIPQQTSFNDCFSTSSLQANNPDKTFTMGGFAGFVFQATFTNCSFDGKVESLNSANSYLGGMSADSIQSTYINCVSKGNISATASQNHAFTGGFSGRNELGAYKNCYSSAAVSSNLTATSGTSIAGGFLGYNSQGGNFTYCYSSGDVSALGNSAQYVMAGSIGYDRQGNYAHCVNAGNIFVRGTTADMYPGGIVGYTANSLFNDNGFAQSSTITLNGQTTAVAHDALNKNGKLIPVDNKTTWEAMSFSFGQEQIAPWQMTANKLPSLFFEEHQSSTRNFSVSPESVTINKGDLPTKTVQVSSPTSWVATSTEPWLTLTNASGTGNGSFSLTASSNMSPQIREGHVLVSSNGRSRILTVTQTSSLVSYDDWIPAQTDPPQAHDRTPQGSYSGDGMSNLEKYALGLDPEKKQPSLGKPKIEKNQFSIEYPANAKATGITLIGERLIDTENVALGWTSNQVTTTSKDGKTIVTSDIPVSEKASQLLRLSLSMTGTATTTTIPCGYATYPLRAKSQNYIPLQVHKPYIYQTTLDQSSTMTLKHTGQDTVILNSPGAQFTQILRAKTTYILEVELAGKGCASFPINVTAWQNPSKESWELTADTVSFDCPALASLLADKTMTPQSFCLREAWTLGDIFGVNNEVGLKKGSSFSADAVFMQIENMGLVKFYYTGTAWRGSVASKYSIENIPAHPHDALIISRKAGANIPLTIMGEALLTPQYIALDLQEQCIGTALPVTQKLKTTGLETSLSESSSSSNSDGVYIPIINTKEKFYFYNTLWRLGTNNSADQGDQPIKGIITLYRRSISPKAQYITIKPVIGKSN